jgi:hypothetical protein
MQGVKDRIKATFVSLIPDPQWEQMVEKEINAFFEPQIFTRIIVKERSSYSFDHKEKWTIETKENTSPFRVMVWDFCKEKTVDALKNAITSKYFTTVADQDLSKEMETVIANAIPYGITNFFKTFAEMQAQELANRIRNHNPIF